MVRWTVLAALAACSPLAAPELHCATFTRDDHRDGTVDQVGRVFIDAEGMWVYDEVDHGNDGHVDVTTSRRWLNAEVVQMERHFVQSGGRALVRWRPVPDVTEFARVDEDGDGALSHAKNTRSRNEHGDPVVVTEAYNGVETYNYRTEFTYDDARRLVRRDVDTFANGHVNLTEHISYGPNRVTHSFDDGADGTLNRQQVTLLDYQGRIVEHRTDAGIDGDLEEWMFYAYEGDRLVRWERHVVHDDDVFVHTFRHDDAGRLVQEAEGFESGANRWVRDFAYEACPEDAEVPGPLVNESVDS